MHRAASILAAGLLAASLSPAGAIIRPLGYDTAAAVFNGLPFAQRIELQVDLTAAGYWPAVPNKLFNGRLFDAISHFQADHGEAQTGYLDREGVSALVSTATPILSGWGFRTVAHPTRGYQLWVPFGLGLQTTETANGLRFADPQGTVTLDYAYYPGMSLQQAIGPWVAKLVGEGDQIVYQVTRPDFFVLAARNPSGVSHYVRFKLDGAGILGFALMANSNAPGVQGERLEAAISASFWSATTPNAPYIDLPDVPAPAAREVSLPQNPEQEAPTPAPPSPAPAPATPAPSHGGFGTGFFVNRDGFLLTNAHVVTGCASVSVETPTGPALARVMASDTSNDLALLKTSLAPVRVASLRPTIRLGEQVAAFGYPLAGLLSTAGNFTLGNVTALSGLEDNSRYLQISTPVQPGNSGGPLVDASGDLVGVVSAKLNALKVMEATEGDIPQNVNFAIKASVAAMFLDSNGVVYSTGTVGTAMPPADLADAAKGLSVRVDCN